MAIEDTYNIISAGIKADKKKERKRQERDELKGLLVKGVVSIGNSMLKDKANSFLETEQFYKENMQFKKGHGIASEYITNEKLAREDTLGYDAYWSNVAPSGQVDAAMTEKYGDIKKYSSADWKANRSELMKEIGMAARKNHEDGLTTAQSFINQAGDKGAEFYADFAKQSRPTTLKDLIMNKAKEALGGNDLNVASRELTRKGYLGDAQTLIAYDKAWDATGNNQVSAFLADTSKTLGGAAPIIKEDFEDMGGTDSLGLPKGKEKVYKAVYWDGSERYVNEDGQASSLKTVRINKKYNNWVSRNSTNSAAATEVQGIGKSALTDYGTPEDIKFFTDLSKEHGKGRSGKAREKAIEDGNRNTQASIAGLKLIFNDDYGMSEQESSRLAVIMHRRKIESREAQKESGVLGANPYSHANALGIALVMAEQQSLTGRPRDFSDADIQEVVSSPSGLKAMFEDYSELTPKAMNEYTELVKQSKNPYLLEVHNRMERFVGISKEKNTQNLSEIYTHYETEQLAKALPVVPPELSGSTSTLSSTTVVPEIVPISKLVKPDAVAISRGSSFLNPMSGKSYAKKIPTQLEAYNKLLALQTVTQRKKQKADESTAALKPEFRNRIGTPQKSAMKSILDLQKAYEDYITKYGE